jgi:hypothetical protein
MTDESGRKLIQPRTSKRRKPLGKRQLAADLTATRLYIPDRLLFQETARRKHLTDAELLRDIVHRWAVVERRAPGTQEDLKEQVLIDLQKETLVKLDAGLKSIADHLGLLVDGSARFGDLLNLNEVQLTRLINASEGHHNVSAERFLALRSLFERAGDRLNLADVKGVEVSIEEPDAIREEVPIEQADVTRDGVSPEEQLAAYEHITLPVAKRINNHLKTTVEREGLMSLHDPLRHEGHVEHIVTTIFETAHEYKVELDPSHVRQIAEHLFTSLRNGMERKNQHLLNLIDPRTPPDTEPEQEADYSSSENN